MAENKVQIVIEALNRFQGTFDELKKQLGSAEGQAKTTSGNMAGSFGALRDRVAILAGEFYLITQSAKMAFDGVRNALQVVMEPIDEFNNSVIKTAALITSFQGNKGDVGENYRQATKYATDLQNKMIEMNSTVSLSAHEMSMVTEEMLKQRVLVDVNNQAQLDGLRNIANAVAVVAGGSLNKEVQIRQEIRALMQGQVNMNSQLSSEINAMVGGTLKEKLELWRQEGTIIEHIGGLLSGYAAASGDIANTWTAIKSTTDTILNVTMRQGFAPVYADIINLTKQINEALKEHAGTINNVIQKAWVSVKAVMESVVTLFGSAAIKTFAGLIATALDGLGIMASVVLPVVAEKIRNIVDAMNALVNLGYLFGKSILDAAGAAGDAIMSVARAAMKALKGDFAGAGAELGKAFSGPYVDALKDNLVIAKGAMAAFGDASVAFTADPTKEMRDRYAKYQSLNIPPIVQAVTPTPVLPPGTPEGASTAEPAGENEALAWKAAQEAAIDYQLFLVDMAEQERTISKADAAEQRIELYKQLLVVQEDYAGKIVKLTDPAGWYAQQKAIGKTREEMLKLNKVVQEQTGTFGGGLKEGFGQYLYEAKKVFQQGVEIAKATAQAMQQAFSDFFFDAMTGKLKSFGEYLKSFLESVARAIANMMAQNTAVGLLGAVKGLFGGSAASGGTAMAGGAAPTAHTGGMIMGPGQAPRFHDGGVAEGRGTPEPRP